MTEGYGIQACHCTVRCWNMQYGKRLAAALGHGRAAEVTYRRGSKIESPTNIRRRADSVRAALRLFWTYPRLTWSRLSARNNEERRASRRKTSGRPTEGAAAVRTIKAQSPTPLKLNKRILLMRTSRR